MNTALDDLLTALSGDAIVAEATFRRFEPLLRKVARRTLTPALRARFDSEDVVQSVWASLLHGSRHAGWRFASVDQLRAFLVTATRNRFLDWARRHGRSRERERLHDLTAEHLPATCEPRPSQIAQREELWQRILAHCPPEHHVLVELKREGLTLDEIAHRTGLHRDSIRRVLRILARQIAFGTTPPAS
jgi:RNA polymerase sigma-70 factor (ECF subfamily)